MDIGIAQRTNIPSTIQTLRQIMEVYKLDRDNYRKQFLSMLNSCIPGSASEDDFDLSLALEGCKGLPEETVDELYNLGAKSHDCYLAYVTLKVAAQKLEAIIRKIGG